MLRHLPLVAALLLAASLLAPATPLAGRAGLDALHTAVATDAVTPGEGERLVYALRVTAARVEQADAASRFRYAGRVEAELQENTRGLAARLPAVDRALAQYLTAATGFGDRQGAAAELTDADRRGFAVALRAAAGAIEGAVHE